MKRKVELSSIHLRNFACCVARIRMILYPKIPKLYYVLKHVRRWKWKNESKFICMWNWVQVGDLVCVFWMNWLIIVMVLTNKQASKQSYLTHTHLPEPKEKGEIGIWILTVFFHIHSHSLSAIVDHKFPIECDILLLKIILNTNAYPNNAQTPPLIHSLESKQATAIHISEKCHSIFYCQRRCHSQCESRYDGLKITQERCASTNKGWGTRYAKKTDKNMNGTHSKRSLCQHEKRRKWGKYFAFDEKGGLNWNLVPLLLLYCCKLLELSRNSLW